MTATAQAPGWRTKRVPEKCEAVLRAIALHRRSHHGYGPTVEEVREAAGISSTGRVLDYMRRLRKSALVSFEDGVSRSVEPTELGWQFVGLEPPCFTTRG